MRILFLFTCVLSLAFSANSQTKGVLTKEIGAAEGYTLFTPLATQETYLINNCGELINSWTGTTSAGMHSELNEDGELYRLEKALQSTFTQGGVGGKLTVLDWDNNVINSYSLNGPDFCQHHDIEILPNGNVLVLVTELKSEQESIDYGRDPSTINEGALWPEAIYEYELLDNGILNMVWSWHSWDHVVQNFDNTKPNFGDPNSERGKFDLNYSISGGKADFMHSNSIDYNPNTDEIIMSVKAFDEVWVIDHSTTEIEAATDTGGNYGRGGEIIYRWGNPSTYNPSVDTTKIFFHGQHDARWLLNENYPERSFTVFNNLVGSDFSSYDLVFPEINVLDEYVMAAEYFLPDTTAWHYTKQTPQEMYSPRISGGQILDNGHFLICSGNQGYFSEIDSLGNIYWEYYSPVNPNGILDQNFTGNASTHVFRANYYPVDFEGFVGKDMTPGQVIELNPTSNICDMATMTEENLNFKVYPNPSNGQLFISSNDIRIKKYSIYSLSGQLVLENSISESKINLENGMYILILEDKEGLPLHNSKIIIQ